MNPWAEPLTTALRAIPKDVDPKAIRKVVGQVLKERQPVKDAGIHTQLIERWCASFETRFGDKYVFQGKDAKAVKALLAIDYGTKVSDPVAHLLRIATAAWEHKEGYPCNMSLTLPKLLSHINEIREWLNTNKDGKATKAIPEFEQLARLRDMKANHPCNRDSIAFDETMRTPDNLAKYAEIKRKLAELEQARNRQVMG